MVDADQDFNDLFYRMAGLADMKGYSEGDGTGRFARDWESDRLDDATVATMLAAFTGRDMDSYQGDMARRGGAGRMTDMSTAGWYNPTAWWRGSWSGEPYMDPFSMTANRLLHFADRKATMTRLRLRYNIHLRDEGSAPTAAWLKNQAAEVITGQISKNRWGIIGTSVTSLEPLQKFLQIGEVDAAGRERVDGQNRRLPPKDGAFVDGKEITFPAHQVVQFEIVEGMRNLIAAGDYPINDATASWREKLTHGNTDAFWEAFTNDGEYTIDLMPVSPEGTYNSDDIDYGSFYVVRKNKQGVGKERFPEYDQQATAIRALVINLSDYKKTNHHRRHLMREELNKIGEPGSLMTSGGPHPNTEQARNFRMSSIHVLARLVMDTPIGQPSEIIAESLPQITRDRLADNPWRRAGNQADDRFDRAETQYLPLEEAMVGKATRLDIGSAGWAAANPALHEQVVEAAEKAHKATYDIMSAVMMQKDKDRPLQDYQDMYKTAFRRHFSNSFTGNKESAGVSGMDILEALGVVDATE